ncbi:hypothetical protein JL193_11340 [Polaribacter batillariae]|uniref:Uncharacterized protein n=1 Tax=Polaribacter batillariae TaxID=2808900 RepID=A0ABX7SR64_9FLAO|nr:hypothetical protein [Polaribacter batillariae]QTD36730.1 hypothetical protein JL193_11340 [Polaribacter batillariae]
MKNLNNTKMQSVIAGYSAWACFTSVPKLILDGASGPSGAAWIGYDIALIKWCWNN